MNEDVCNEIARLEEHIEALRLSIERCRKISFVAKALITAAALTIGLMFTGALTSTLMGTFPHNPTLFFLSLAAVIGGAVLLGSNKTSWEQTNATLHEAERMRNELIRRVDRSLVGENRI
jgi:flagellar biosynthesis component FlhA